MSTGSEETCKNYKMEREWKKKQKKGGKWRKMMENKREKLNTTALIIVKMVAPLPRG